MHQPQQFMLIDYFVSRPVISFIFHSLLESAFVGCCDNHGRLHVANVQQVMHLGAGVPCTCICKNCRYVGL